MRELTYEEEIRKRLPGYKFKHKVNMSKEELDRLDEAIKSVHKDKNFEIYLNGEGAPEWQKKIINRILVENGLPPF
ncbi:MAG: hypothetical protein HQK65_15640 [Desulfamplus sp.]|nr:hypothetical protein [Desulfamplus sp.]